MSARPLAVALVLDPLAVVAPASVPGAPVPPVLLVTLPLALALSSGPREGAVAPSRVIFPFADVADPSVGGDEAALTRLLAAVERTLVGALGRRLLADTVDAVPGEATGGARWRGGSDQTENRQQHHRTNHCCELRMCALFGKKSKCAYNAVHLQNTTTIHINSYILI